MLITDIMESQSNQFSATELKLVAYIRNNPNIIFKTITEVIEESKSDWMIIRFLQEIGCGVPGFQDPACKENPDESPVMRENSLLGKYRKLATIQLENNKQYW